MSLKSVKTLTPAQIAKKWKLSQKTVDSLIDDGAKVEHEHDKDMKNAREIARDHISERPDYYKKLRKMEKTKIMKMSEESSTVGVRGLGYVSGDPSGVDYVQKYIDTNSMSYNDTNGNNLKWIKKHTKGHNKVGFNEYDPRKLKEGISAGPERESDYSIGDPTGSSRKISKVDEVRLPAKARKAIATGMTVANLYTAGDVASRAQQGIGHPVKDVIAAASTLPGTKGWTAYAADKARQAYDYVKGKKMQEDSVNEATFQGKKVPLNKPMKGDVKKSKVYVDPDGDGKAQKVNFGDPNMTIKKSNPARRKSFRARHNCDNPGPKTKARYWSCRAWEETQLAEVKAETLGSYIKKAAESRKKSLVGPKPDIKTWGKREHGIRTAIKKLTKEETTMDTKDIINEAIDNILNNNLVDMKENLSNALQEKAMERLEEKKKEIASNYFAQ